MKKQLVLIAFCFLVGFTAQAQNRSVNFEHGTFAESQAKAKAANKPIFFDGFAVWCGPCKYMSNTVFTQDKVADFFNSNFINVKFDMEKGEGIELAKKYGVKAYPTFLILDSTGRLIHKIVGGDEADSFIAKVKEGLNPETSLASQMDKYQAGNRDPKFIRSYLTTLQTAYMQPEAEEVAQQYLRSLNEKQKTSIENWPIYNDYVNDPFSKDFIFILTNRIKFTDVVGDSALNAKISAVFYDKSMSYLVNRRGTVYTKEEVAKLRDFVRSSNSDNTEKFASILYMADTKAMKDGVTLAAQVQDYFKNYKPTDQESYNILSQTLPTILDYANKNEWMLISQLIDKTMSNLKEEKAKPYFQNMKDKLDAKINPSK